jgi:hypothetical protein
MKVPGGCHLDQAKYILRYLLTTKDFDLRLGGSEGADDLIGYVDADYANEEIRRSGYAFFSGVSLISWWSTRETTVARSTMEAEYQAAGEATKKAMHLLYIRSFLDCEVPCTHIWIDNEPALNLIMDPLAAAHVKYIDIVHHHIREREEANLVKFVGIASEDNVADVLTKPLPRFPFQTFRSKE